MDDKTVLGYMVVCEPPTSRGCNAHGPIKSTANKAALAWQKRVDTKRKKYERRPIKNSRNS